MTQLDPYRVPAGDYLRQLARMYLRARWAWFLAPLLLCSALAVWLADVRWFIVAMMLLFVAIPMVLSLAYINYALSMEARWALLEKSLTLNDDGILLHFTDQRMHDRLISWDEVSEVKVAGEAFLVMLKVRRFTFLMIPFSAIEQSGVRIKQFSQCMMHNHNFKNRQQKQA